jgi:DNA invertase Pin-like site-specific DNA recombinase
MSRIRCAIYTRKSTDEGLDQDFNSLDAQREACEAYITSQSGEGWRLIKTRYDDGAYSGATMERPALKHLLADIDSGKVDTVLVYKVDRLTRSLADFAKIVEIFDAHQVSFVSITQQFNTTTSMGRLTLNMLLSFAQFEREVTGERIRDKIAASKKKGMWMGGVVPLGYDSVDKKLVINNAEAETVRNLFRLYLKHKNVRIVKQAADRLGLATKARKPNNGSRCGGEPFTRGHIYKLLANPIYIGNIVHNGQSYPGEHESIIDRETWDAVQDQLSQNAIVRRHGSNAQDPSLLAGLIVDGDGARMAPSHANKAGRRYRYYISKANKETNSESNSGWRLPATEIETVVLSGLNSFLKDELRLMACLDMDDCSPKELQCLLRNAASLAQRIADAAPAGQREILLDLIDHVQVQDNLIRIMLHSHTLHALVDDASLKTKRRKRREGTDNSFALDLAVAFKKRGAGTKLILSDGHHQMPTPDPKLIAAVSEGRRWFAELKNGKARSIQELAELHAVNRTSISRLLPFAFLAPDIVEAILNGRQPVELTVSRLKQIGDLPVSWQEQRRLLQTPQ